MNKTSMGLNENVAGLLCYLFGWVSGLVFFLLEKDSRFVRFHAFQSIVVFGSLNVLMIVIRFIPAIRAFSSLLSILGLVLAIVLMVKAYQMQMFKIPVAGDMAEQEANK
jgi:uncharacterized membrane protein